jgi:hypothetical protein
LERIAGAPAIAGVSSPPTLATVRAWRIYALASLIPLAIFVDILAGPSAQEPFEPLQGVDFGAFYASGMLVREGRVRELGDMNAQRDAQRRLQEREQTGWSWYNALPHPPAVILAVSPLAALPLRTAYWVWAIAGLIAAGTASWLLARAYCPLLPVAAAAVLVTFEPVWDVAWWGQIDSLVLLPVALGSVLLLRPRNGRRDLAAGVLLGFLALKPIFFPLPFVVFALGRPRAAVGMALAGGALALVSVAAVGFDGARDYVELARYYREFSGSPMIVEWRMYNLRGLAMRVDLGLDTDVLFWLVLSVSLALALLTVVVAGRALRADRSPDLAIGLIMLGTVLTAYHVHVQSLVLLTVPIAACIGRSSGADTPLRAVFWALPAVAIHGGAMLLRPHLPSPAATEARLETMLTVVCFAAMLLIALVLAIQDIGGSRHRRA